MVEEIRLCRICGVASKKAHISVKGYCPTCGVNRILENAKALRNKRGEAYKRWKAGMKAWVENLKIK